MVQSAEVFWHSASSAIVLPPSVLSGETAYWISQVWWTAAMALGVATIAFMAISCAISTASATVTCDASAWLVTVMVTTVEKDSGAKGGGEGGGGGGEGGEGGGGGGDGDGGGLGGLGGGLGGSKWPGGCGGGGEGGGSGEGEGGVGEGEAAACAVKNSVEV